jgi:hypothetical protein
MPASLDPASAKVKQSETGLPDFGCLQCARFAPEEGLCDLVARRLWVWLCGGVTGRSVIGCRCCGMGCVEVLQAGAGKAGAMLDDGGDVPSGSAVRLSGVAAGFVGGGGTRWQCEHRRALAARLRQLLAGVAVFLSVFGVVVVVAVACEGTGGPPANPPASELTAPPEGESGRSGSHRGILRQTSQLRDGQRG